MKCEVSYVSSEGKYGRIVDINTIEDLENLPERINANPDPEAKEYAWKLNSIDAGSKYDIVFSQGEEYPEILIYDYYIE